jgi:hypothetical protein
VIEPSDHLEQALRAIAPTRIDAEAFDETRPARGSSVGFDLAHGSSVRRVSVLSIGPRADLGCG